MIPHEEIPTSPKIKIIGLFPHPTAVQYDEDLWQQQHGNDMVIIDCMATQIYFPEHWSPLSIKCAFGGKEYYHFGNRSLAVGDDNFLLLNEGAVYGSSIDTLAPTESFTLNFTSRNIREVYSGMAFGSVKLLDQPFSYHPYPIRFVEKLHPHNLYLSHILFSIRRLVKSGVTSNQQYVELLYATLENMVLLHLSTDLEIEQIHAMRRSTREELYKRLHLARDYMDSCFSEDISLHQLGSICYLNPYHLLRQFRKNFGITPHQYLMKRRMKEASRLLRNTTDTITDIARQVGIFDLSSFSKLFKKLSGKSPEQFRNDGRHH